MRYRMASAALSLVGLFIALYLYLYQLGFVGTLVCGANAACEQVQLSPYSKFLGLDVPLIGAGGYLTLLVLSLLALERPAEPRWPRLLRWLSGIGVGFTLYLTYVELFVIHAVCRWCVASAVIITLILGAALLDRPGVGPSPPPPR